MSRSYKAPFVKGGGIQPTRWAKRQAAKRVRRYKDLPDGKSYRKVYPSYDINDFCFLDSSERGIRK